MSIRPLLLLVAVSFLASFTERSLAGPLFEAQVIDDKVLIGYGVAVGDLDGDGRDDVLLADKSEFVWYRNGDWQRRPLVGKLTLQDNVCIAVADLDGDRRVEVAVGGQWNPGETSDGAKSGSVHFLLRPLPGETAWRAVSLPHDPTVHRMRWVRDPEGRPHLVVLPLHGIGNENGQGANGVKVSVHTPPLEPEKWGDLSAWTLKVVDRSMHKTHNFDEYASDLIIGGQEGIVRRSVVDESPEDRRIIRPDNSEPSTKGVGEVRISPDGRFIAAIEPMHGTDLVVYEEKADERGQWKRTLLTGDLVDGHALAVADVLGTGTAQVVVGWRKPDKAGKVGVVLYERGAEGAWVPHVVDNNTMACEDLKVADLNGDGLPEIIAAGRATNNLVIYWNKSTK